MIYESVANHPGSCVGDTLFPACDSEDGDDPHSDEALERGIATEAEFLASAEGARPRPRFMMQDMFKVPKEGVPGVRFSSEAALKEITEVLQWRKEMMGDTDVEIMPFEQQKLLHAMHFEAWKNDEANAKTVDCRRLFPDRVSNRNRQLKSAHRHYCYERFGGREWLYLIIAIGDLNDDVAAAMKQAIQQKLEELRDSKDEETWTPTEVLRLAKEHKLALAAMHGKPRPKGIEHKVSEAKVWREKGKYLDRLKARAKAGKYYLTWSQWYELVANADEAWSIAEELSETAGVPHIGRDGEWKFQVQQDRSLVATALRIYSEIRARRQL